ncbi:hypothetical protein J8L98_10810 [Pseudoalteromonas sp. MMG013]|uniref:hypothetical protein n=1 Tax=Pseudoalteromonas sp. MMG013 TaxID=2822687 RepID=UPI001B35CBEE|nr:hypothetical protein [Pseudoalteromonas sp. MMG013]MBQ4862178.1 hypothetical protein [Pseudoalteromonas sp. MMG013]
MALKIKARMENVLPESKLADGSIEKLFPSGNRVRFYPFEINSSDIPDNVKQSKFNPRRYDDLKLPAIQDILPSIQDAKRNTYHIYTVGSRDNYKVVVGLRRVFAVKQIENALLIGYRAAHLEEVDEKYLAQFSDVYVAPSFVDIGLTISTNQEFSKLSSRVLGDIFKVSKDTANMAQRISKLPKALWELFPAYQHITFRFVKELTALNAPKEKLELAAQNVKAKFEADIVAYKFQDNERDYAVLSKKIEQMLLAELKPKQVKPKNPWEPKFNFKQISTKLDSKGRLSITFSEDTPEETITKVADLLKNELS